MKYRFESFEFDQLTHELKKNGQPIALEPQVFALLELLIANADRVVSKEELNERVWGGRVVSDAAINSRIKTARQALDDDGNAQRLIKTVRGKGFRFVGTPEAELAPAVSFVTAEPAPASAPAPASVEQRERPAIAVLPLTLLSLDTRYEPLADAIAHEVIADLSRLHWMKVISGASTFKLRSGELDLSQIATLLGVEYVLSGSLSLFGEKANVIVELTDARDMKTIWAERFDSSMDELIELRAELATQIANHIEQRIQVEEAARSDTLCTEDLDAWTTYFRALRHVNRFNAHDNQVGMQLFERAIALDSGFALAHAGLSFAHFQNGFVGYVNDVEGAQTAALSAAERAFELDPLDPVVNLMVGRAKFLRGEWEQAGPWFERCATISPNNALAYYHQCLIRNASGQTGDVHDLTEQALTLSPIDPLQYAFLGVRALGHLSNGQVEKAGYWGERAANAPRAHHLIDAIAAVTQAAAGESDRARQRASRVLARAPEFSQASFFRSLPMHDDLKARVATHFDELGFREA